MVKQKTIVISYNAWENDYFSDPFVSLVGQIISDYPEINDLSIQEMIKSATSLISSAAPLVTTVINVKSYGFPGIFSSLIKNTPEVIKKIKILWRRRFCAIFSDYLKARMTRGILRKTSIN